MEKVIVTQKASPGDCRIWVEPLAEYISEGAKLITGSWQPIKTAPKDGTHILAYGESRYSIVEDEIQAIIFWWEKPYSRGSWRALHGLEGMVFRPTHWMSLPPAPVEQAFAESLDEREEVYRKLASS